MSVNIYKNSQLSPIAGNQLNKEWVGTRAEWNAMSQNARAQYDQQIVNITDDYECFDIVDGEDNIYSGNEVVVGKYFVDETHYMPVYRKCITLSSEVTLNTLNSWQSIVSVAGLNINDLLRCDCKCDTTIRNNDRIFCVIDDYLKYYAVVSNGGMVVNKFIIEYTKTTDIDSPREYTQSLKITQSADGIAYNGSVDATNVSDAIDKLNIANVYSEQEQVIGKWIDGRNIYKRVFIITQAGGDAVNITIPNIAGIINHYGYSLNSNGDITTTIPFTNTNVNTYELKVYVEVSTQRVVFSRGTAHGSGKAYLVLEYIKKE